MMNEDAHLDEWFEDKLPSDFSFEPIDYVFDDFIRQGDDPTPEPMDQPKETRKMPSKTKTTKPKTPKGLLTQEKVWAFARYAIDHFQQCTDEDCELYWATVKHFKKE